MRARTASARATSARGCVRRRTPTTGRKRHDGLGRHGLFDGPHRLGLRGGEGFLKHLERRHIKFNRAVGTVKRVPCPF
jgi:hypothetical protein